MSLFSLFSKNNTTSELSMDQFINILKSNNNAGILQTLNFPIDKLSKAGEYELKANPDDVRNGVVEVQYLNHTLNILGIFKSCVIKKYNTGRKQYFFHTTTGDPNLVIKTANALSDALGSGIYDDRINSSFKEISKIEGISNGIGTPPMDECVTMWVVRDNLSVWLQYRLNPMKQFILLFDEH